MSIRLFPRTLRHGIKLAAYAPLVFSTAIAEPAEKTKPAEQKAAQPSVQQLFQLYRQSIAGLKGSERLLYAASIPVPNNAAKAFIEERAHHEKKLMEMTANGLGEKHPETRLVRNRIKALDTQAEKESIAKVITQLHTIPKALTPQDVKKRHISEIKDQITELRAKGLGEKHPRIALLLHTLKRIDPTAESE